ncbi:MAG: hypothetical protein WC306_03635 [Candidatus Paceibacterota bacterium]|jgi:hypothetical protein
MAKRDDDFEELRSKMSKVDRETRAFKSLMSELNDTLNDMKNTGADFYESLGQGIKDIMSNASSLDTLMQRQSKAAVQSKKFILSTANILSSVTDITKQIELNNRNILSDKFAEIDASEAISDIEQLRLSITNKLRGKNVELKKALSDMLDVQMNQLVVMDKIYKKQVQTKQIATDMAEELTSPINNILEKLGSIPLFGKALQTKLQPAVEKLTNNFSSGLVKMFETGKISAAGFGSSIITFAKDIGAAMMGPLAIFAAIAGLVVLGIMRLHEMHAAAEDVRKETGIMKSQASDLEHTLANVNVQYSSMGVTIEVAAEAAKALSKEMGNVAGMTKEAIGTVSLLNANYGVGATEAAGVYKKLFDFTGGNVKQINGLLGEAISISDKLGISFAGVMSDIADSGEEVHTYFQGDEKALLKAAINARRLGLNLKSVTSMAESLLDFDTSMESEMNASAIIGKNVNFAAARYSFLTGQMEQGTNQIYEQINALGDFNTMNAIAKKELAKAAGLSVEELGTMMNQKKVLSAMSAEERRRYEIGLKELDSIQNSVDLQKENLLREQQMQSTTTKISNIWNSIVSLLAGSLLPILEALEPILFGVLWLVKTALDAINTTIQAIYGVIKWIGGSEKAWEGTQSAGAAFRGNFGAMAEGGIVTKPTLSMIGEGGTPEAVIPLDASGIKTQSDPAVLKLLEEILNTLKLGGDVYLDGRKVGTRLAMAASNPIQ